MKTLVMGVLLFAVASFADDCRWTKMLEKSHLVPDSRAAWNALIRAQSENEDGDCDKFVTCRWYDDDRFYIPTSKTGRFMLAAIDFEKSAGCGLKKNKKKGKKKK